MQEYIVCIFVGKEDISFIYSFNLNISACFHKPRHVEAGKSTITSCVTTAFFMEIIMAL